VAAVALLAALGPATAAQAATTAAAGTQIKIGHSNKCLNVQGNSTANSAKIVQYACSSTATNDKFKLVPKGSGTYWIQGVGSGKCFNVQGNSTANSAVIIQYTCATTANSLWWIDEVPDKPTVRLMSTSSGKCLNIQGNTTANSAALIQYTCSASATSLNEQFYFPPTTSATAAPRPFTAKQPISAVQGAAPSGGTVAPLYYSYISADNQLTLLTDRNPDPYSTDPNPPEPVFRQTANSGYTGRTYSLRWRTAASRPSRTTPPPVTSCRRTRRVRAAATMPPSGTSAVPSWPSRPSGRSRPTAGWRHMP
jgi:hypothetical protein